MTTYKCSICGKELSGWDAYEYRGAYSCVEHFDQMTQSRDRQRAEIIAEEDAKTKVFKGLDMSESTIGKANNFLLKRHKEIASKESQRLKDYEGRS